MTFCGSRCKSFEITFSECPSCGNKLKAQSSADGSPASYSTAIALSGVDKSALRKLWVFAIITLAGSIIVAVFLAWEYLLFAKQFSLSGIFETVEVPNTGIAHLYIDAILPEFVLTNALTVVAIFPLRSALGDLSRVGCSGYRTPRIMMLVMFVCVLVTVAGRVFNPEIVSQAPYWLLSIIVLLLDAATLGTIVGQIGGETLGIWLMGLRYKENLFKASSIPLIIPVIQLVSPILILIGLRRLSRYPTVRS